MAGVPVILAVTVKTSSRYMATGSLVVCANLKCGTSLRISSHRPLRVEPVSGAAGWKGATW